MNDNYIEKNRKRWLTLPAGYFRGNVSNLLHLPDFILKKIYNFSKSRWDKERSWEYERYSEMIRGLDVLEIGGGMGYDGIIYSKVAKSYTFGEIHLKQIEFLKRAFMLMNEKRDNVFYEYLEDPFKHVFPKKYQAFFAFGVLHHIPFEEAQKQFAQIDKYLDSGAFIVLLMYPKKRWEKAGRPSFEKFGKYTDGGCPWAEWYDEEKIMRLVGEGYKLKHTKYWGFALDSDSEFVNFELVKK